VSIRSCKQKVAYSVLRSGCPVKGGAWLQRFDDVARVEKSCIAKAKKGKN